MLFRFVYSYTDYDLLIQDLARTLKVPVTENTVVFPVSVGTGTYTFLKLPNGIQVSFTDCHLNDDWLVQRSKNDRQQEVYTLRFNELIIPGSLQVTIGDEKLKEFNTSRSVVYLTSSLFDWSYFGTKGTTFRGVDVLFTREWFTKYMGISDDAEAPLFYLSMQAERFTMEPLDYEYRRLMAEIKSVDNENPLKLTIVQNRVMLMMERFFIHAYEKMQQALPGSGLSKNDISRMMEVEHIITFNLFDEAPAISELAKKVSVSASKLKKDFKKLFGHPVHEYYRKERMKAARDRLLTGNYSVKQVALELGYSNLSNFTNAFKKEFSILPSELI